MTEQNATILDKVRKLLRLAGNNPNAEEAASAAAHAQKLLDSHNLSRAMLELDPAGPGHKPAPDEPIQDFGLGAMLDNPGRDRARVALASTIARANACRIYTSAGRVCLVGRPTDAETVRYLYAWIAGEMDRLADRNGRGMGRVWRANYKLGIVDTIHRKLRESRAATATEARESAAHNPQALVLVNQALANVEQKSASVEQWMKSYMRLGKGRASGGRSDYGAREAGRRAGESIALGGGRPLTSGAARLRP